MGFKKDVYIYIHFLYPVVLYLFHPSSPVNGRKVIPWECSRGKMYLKVDVSASAAAIPVGETSELYLTQNVFNKSG